MGENSNKIESWYLRAGGAPAGSINANANGATTPVVYSLDPAQLGLSYVRVTRLLIHIEDVGTIGAEEYGARSTLTSGVRIQYTKDGTTYDLDGGEGVKSNADWSRCCYDMTNQSFGAGNNFVAVRWTFTKSTEPLLLRSGDTLDVTIQDDLTGLVRHSFFAQGVRP